MKGSFLNTRVLGGGAFLFCTFLIFSCGQDPTSDTTGGPLKTLTAHNPADLDPSFGTGGIVTSDLSGMTDTGSSLAIQADGRVVVAGTSMGQMTLARYNTDGTLDGTFGTGGKAMSSFSGSASARDVALQPDGKLVVVGDFYDPTGNRQFATARFNPDGSLDSSFGTGGMVVYPLSVPPGPPLPPYQGTGATAVVIQSDGKIVAAGFNLDTSVTTGIRLVRYLPDGSLDTTFGGDGSVFTRWDIFQRGSASGVAIQPDGKVVVVGDWVDQTVAFSESIAVVRYLPDGSLDTGFGVNGTLLLSVMGMDWGSDLHIQEDGKIVLAGFGSDPLDNKATMEFVLARLNPDGSLDPGFGSGGTVTTDFGDHERAYALAVQQNGKLVVTGSSRTDNNNPVTRFALARYSPEGILDSTFGNLGLVITEIDAYSEASGVGIQPDGKIVAAGTSRTDSADSSTSDFALARYLTDSVVLVEGDLTVSKIGSIGPGAIPGEYVVGYTITVDNLGPNPVDASLVDGNSTIQFRGALNTTQGSCIWTGTANVSCQLGLVGVGSPVTITLSGTLGLGAASNTNTAVVFSTGPPFVDPDTSNNSVTLTLTASLSTTTTTSTTPSTTSTTSTSTTTTSTTSTTSGGGGVTRPTVTRPPRPDRPTVVRPPRPSVR